LMTLLKPYQIQMILLLRDLLNHLKNGRLIQTNNKVQIAKWGLCIFEPQFIARPLCPAGRERSLKSATQFAPTII